MSTKAYEWRKTDGMLALHRAGRRGPVLCIVRDATFPTAWRIRRPDGTITDMLNVSRAKDVAMAIALAA
jgi:hypothetical protein